MGNGNPVVNPDQVEATIVADILATALEVMLAGGGTTDRAVACSALAAYDAWKAA